MNYDSTTRSCIADTGIDSDVDNCTVSQTDARCSDALFAFDNPVLCGVSGATIQSIYVNPVQTVLEVGRTFPFRAFVIFSDGREAEVTDSSETEWELSTGSDLFISNQRGDVTGVAQGVAMVKASWRGFDAYSDITVVAACAWSDTDTIIVLDKSGSMGIKDVQDQTRWENAQAAASIFVQNTNFLQDRIGVIAFSGVIVDESTTLPNAVVLSGFSTSQAILNSAISAARPPVDLDDCLTFNDVPVLQSCTTSIGGGLDAAHSEMSANARPGVRKLVILLTDGMEKVCNPEPLAVASAMKADGIILVVIALAINDATQPYPCGMPGTGRYNYLNDMATPNFFFAANCVNALPNIYSQLPYFICSGNTPDSTTYPVSGQLLPDQQFCVGLEIL